MPAFWLISMLRNENIMHNKTFIIIPFILVFSSLDGFTQDKVTKSTNTKKLSSDIIEGVGWKTFCIGATKEELIKAFGKPDSDTNDELLQWRKKYGIHCLIDDTRGAYQLRFDTGFKGKTTAGIEIGSSLKQAIEAYGEPDSTVVQNINAKKLEWSSKGLFIWFHNEKAAQIVVFKPYTPKK